MKKSGEDRGYFEKPLFPQEKFAYLLKTWGLTDKPHFHNRLEFVYVLEGEMKAICDGEEIIAKKNDIVIVNPMESHSYQGISDVSESLFYVVVIGDFYLRDYSMNYRNKIFKNLLDDKEYNETVVKEYFDKWFKRWNSNALFNIGYMDLILALLTEHYEMIEVNDDIMERQLKLNIADFIDAHYQEPLTLKSVAEQIGYNATYFSELFMSVMGQPFKGYLTKLRMRKALELIEQSNMTNEEAAFKVGFNSLSAFYRAKQNYK